MDLANITISDGKIVCAHQGSRGASVGLLALRPESAGKPSLHQSPPYNNPISETSSSQWWKWSGVQEKVRIVRLFGFVIFKNFYIFVSLLFSILF
jgi:hypothetical protein